MPGLLDAARRMSEDILGAAITTVSGTRTHKVCPVDAELRAGERFIQSFPRPEPPVSACLG